jgi:phosphopantetheinyl transferase
MNEVLILHAPLAGTLEDVHADALLMRLPYARRLQLERREPAGRHASLAGVALALAGAARLRGRPVEPGQLEFPADGKPSLAGGPNFSVAHSATRVAVAISDVCQVGLDLEDATAAAPDDAGAMLRLQRWTAIEAALKAVGAGLQSIGRLRMADDLATATFAGVELKLHVVEIDADCVARLATQARSVDLTIERMPVPWSCGASAAT